MTQAYNLAILANAVDSSGKLNVGTNATGVLPVANGGTGLSSTPTNGQLDIGNGSGFTRATITAGSGISVTNGAGSITIATSGGGGVTSLNGQTGAITNTSTNTIGSYYLGYSLGGSASWAYGNTTSGSNLRGWPSGQEGSSVQSRYSNSGFSNPGNSGTWRSMTYAANGPDDGGYFMHPTLWVRVS
jgi:hypothetical protein